jgi:hypothetical protein
MTVMMVVMMMVSMMTVPRLHLRGSNQPHAQGGRDDQNKSLQHRIELLSPSLDATPGEMFGAKEESVSIESLNVANSYHHSPANCLFLSS